jgi:hypothetical protein
MDGNIKVELKKYYKYIFVCSICNKFYGSDQIETSRFLCPLHDLKFKEANKRILAKLLLLKSK